ncbi:MAG: alpha-galactosidase [Bacteroidetes bacterium]|nr:alpha-galactosidase [Bacteroidota bacterium]
MKSERILKIYRQAIPIAILIFYAGSVFSQDVKRYYTDKGNCRVFTMKNDKVSLNVVVKDNQLAGDSLVANKEWLTPFGTKPFAMFTDGDFGLEFVWTDWQAPHTAENAENPVILSKKDFTIDAMNLAGTGDEGAELVLHLKGKDLPILVDIIYRMEPGKFYIKRKISVRDTTFGHHFLDRIIPMNSTCEGILHPGTRNIRLEQKIIHAGSFGQPVAIQFSLTGGAFFGLEYPASTNKAEITGPATSFVGCSQEVGVNIGKKPFESEWVVEGITPTRFIKEWFFRYLDDMKVAPALPYTLYNSWYDLRSPEYPKVQPAHVMNEQNVFNIIHLFRKNMVEKHHIKLDAFVLDDGWDVYQSDWVMRKETFPRGLKPVSDTLKQLGTTLGIWIGPTGGYSFRMKRINWMKEHGYEIVGTGRDNSMLCLAGKKYSALFRKRITDLVTNDQVGYFKWDGIQFACSEPDHGHPVGIYSRRALMESVIDKCNSVRNIDPKVYLNITSGTWLSPWWVKYANQIWMQGEDYGFADVPSVSQRDAAMTYKDFVLYDDLRKQDWWFPISNLMTHGIIKGNLERLGGEDDPLDKFTNDAVFYVARGISMWELYISPDLLTDNEWDAIGASVNWAKDRFPVLANTHMIGGNPMNRETYGYLHFNGKHGILAVRNPSVTSSEFTLPLYTDYGIDPSANHLVVEMVYPYRWISPKLYNAGMDVSLSLEGYETAIYEIYPVADAKEPLLSGVRFDVAGISGTDYELTLYDAPDGITLLNPDLIKETHGTGIKSELKKYNTGKVPNPVINSRIKIDFTRINGTNTLKTRVELHSSVHDAKIAVLLKPDKGYEEMQFPEFTFLMDSIESKTSVEQQEGLWSWNKANISTGSTMVTAKIKNRVKTNRWKGKAAIYIVCHQSINGKKVGITTTEKIPLRPMPPKPFPGGISEKIVFMGVINIDIN